jgi:hypothetical protein
MASLANVEPTAEEFKRFNLEEESADKASASGSGTVVSMMAPISQRLQSATKEKNNGNDMYRAGLKLLQLEGLKDPKTNRIKDSEIFNAMAAKADGKKKVQAAIKHYDLAFVAMYYQKEELNHLFSAQEKKAIVALKVTLHLNRAQCKLKLSQWSAAAFDCDEAIKLDKTCMKGYQRRISARLGMIKEERDKEVRGQFWDIDNTWAHSELAYGDYLALKELVLSQEEEGNKEEGKTGSGSGAAAGNVPQSRPNEEGGKPSADMSALRSLQKKLAKARKHLKACKVAFKKACNDTLRERLSGGSGVAEEDEQQG